MGKRTKSFLSFLKRIGVTLLKPEELELLHPIIKNREIEFELEMLEKHNKEKKTKSNEDK